MASEKITALVEEVKGLTVLELSELVHTLEEVFGVSAAAAAVAAPVAAAVFYSTQGRLSIWEMVRPIAVYRTIEDCPMKN